MSPLATVALAVIVPIGVVGSLQVGDVNGAIARERGERVGVTCLSRGFAMLQRLLALEQASSPARSRALKAAVGTYVRSACPRTLDFSALAKMTPSTHAEVARLALDIDHLINYIADTSSLTYDSDFVVTDSADGSAYALADALPALAAAGTSPDRIAVAKSEATAASRLALLNGSDIDQMVHAAPWAAKRLRAPQARLEARVAVLFSRLDRWEEQTTTVHSDVRRPLRETLAAAGDLFRSLAILVDERLGQNIAQLERKRAFVIATAIILVSFALLIVLLVGRNILAGHRRELSHLAGISYKEARFKAIFVSSPQPIAITDRDGNVIECNEAYRILVGASLATYESLPLFAPLRSHAPLAIAEFLKPIDGKRSESANGEFKLIRGDDSEICCIATATTIESLHGDVHYYAVMLSDVTERERKERHLRRQATHDRLTDVGNREHLLDHLERCLTSTGAMPRFALLFIDVDDFKSINDTLGHLAGDACLQTFARRLRLSTRAGDIVARYGGDEFAVLLCDRASLETAGDIAERLRRELMAPIEFGEHVLVVSSSIGIAIDTGNVLDSQDVIAAADRAMYLDKVSKTERSVSIQRADAFAVENRA